ncbi:hypothetical protein EDB85DRAFT_535319 [Lactarius pseudohatsudake]|nr:hypothetical protein EDB85DRAFT_535319 [Lactarius pseudohatsudake]
MASKIPLALPVLSRHVYAISCTHVTPSLTIVGQYYTSSLDPMTIDQSYSDYNDNEPALVGALLYGTMPRRILKRSISSARTANSTVNPS